MKEERPKEPVAKIAGPKGYCGILEMDSGKGNITAAEWYMPLAS